jgi:predicted DCC family thiol-disulfide oxidoreductase YuxK
LSAPKSIFDVKPTLTGNLLMLQEPLVIFDTNCVLCSRVIAFILAHERDDTLHFMGAWSEEGLEFAARHGFSQADLDKTYLVVENGTVLTRSDASLAIAAHLKAPWYWLRGLRILPKAMRDAAYNIVAEHRYRWFGERENCTIVPSRQRHRFIGVT